MTNEDHIEEAVRDRLRAVEALGPYRGWPARRRGRIVPTVSVGTTCVWIGKPVEDATTAHLLAIHEASRRNRGNWLVDVLCRRRDPVD